MSGGGETEGVHDLSPKNHHSQVERGRWRGEGWRGVEAKTNFAQFSQAVVGLVDGKHRKSTPGTVSICPSLIIVPLKVSYPSNEDFPMLQTV